MYFSEKLEDEYFFLAFLVTIYGSLSVILMLVTFLAFPCGVNVHESTHTLRKNFKTR